MSSETEEKTERLLRLCSQEGLGGVLLNSQPNFAWLTAGGKNGVDSSRDNGVATLFVRRDGKRFVLANRIEMPRIISEELKGEDYEPLEFGWEEEKANPTILNQLANSVMTERLPLGCDIPNGEAMVIESAIARARCRLTPEEVERFKRLGQDTARIIGELAQSLTPGATEMEVACSTREALAAIGIDPIVMLAAGDDRLRRYRHPLPKDVSWKKVLMIVVCARRDGLVASLTRIVCAGSIPDDLRTRTYAAAQVNKELLAATRPGVTGSELYAVAANAYRANGFPGEEKLHHQGGAAGYRTREWVAHPKSTDQVQMNQAFAWNPSVTGTKIEETVIAFENRVEVITTTPGWPTIPVDVQGRTCVLSDVLPI